MENNKKNKNYNQKNNNNKNNNRKKKKIIKGFSKVSAILLAGTLAINTGMKVKQRNNVNYRTKELVENDINKSFKTIDATKNTEKVVELLYNKYPNLDEIINLDDDELEEKIIKLKVEGKDLISDLFLLYKAYAIDNEGTISKITNEKVENVEDISVIATAPLIPISSNRIFDKEGNKREDRYNIVEHIPVDAFVNAKKGDISSQEYICKMLAFLEEKEGIKEKAKEDDNKKDYER